ncbi:PAS domain-containing sensor histidine kinase [Hymenobacter taeanensis]|uniref:histidine kinase n=1 Tax=Hymenobacter taeanensis TaxID=2735321 RepID=A0A6M6BF35_9BACT|nr:MULTISPECIES: PAS domain-containing sensor histidine kinase [Hymenobacter]QJX46458.1 PAS domain-containing sensor histidine kinase [Hymenobacter taeanensis]UOQ80323.1 PAS domain-containing sensor histidine kinase [Hymenobacter sp. 5414T-23]
MPAGRILYAGLRDDTLALLHQQLADAMLEPLAPGQSAGDGPLLRQYDLLLIGPAIETPIRVAQEAYAVDKLLSVLLLAEASLHEKLKQALLFSPFVGPTVQSASVAVGARLVPIVEDAVQRTMQRRSFAKLKSISLSGLQFEPQVVAKVRADFSTKVLEEAPMGAVLVSGTGTVASINRYALELFGRPETQVLGTVLSQLFPAAVRPALEAFLHDGYLGVPKQLFAVPWPAGTLYLEVSVTAIDTPVAGEYHLVMLNDTTATVLAQQQAQADVQALQRANADLDNFIYSASHDLKAPISNIEGLLTALREELAAPATAAAEVPPLLDLMQGAVERFKRTIDHLTDLTKLQKVHLQPADAVDLAAVVEDVRLDLLAQLQATAARLDVDLAQAPTLLFSPKNLRSIVYNLLSNALKYRHPDRAPHVWLRSYPADAYHVLEVQDNGLGLDAGQQAKLFGLFQRLHDHVEGSGVGLYMVRKIMENAGGRIEVASRVGKGSTFRVYFPREPY